MDNCIFCKIIAGEIPCAKVFENEHILAFLDLSQVTKGHTLVIPKTHVQDIFAMPAEVARNFFEAVPKIAKSMEKQLDLQGLNILNNNKEIAGQTVFHFHMHLLPRYETNEGFDVKWQSHQGEYTSEQLQEIALKINSGV